jgi:hypothetical protein
MTSKPQREFPTTKEEYIGELDSGREALLAATANLSPETLGARPQPDRWSALEILYHLNLAETRIAGSLAAVIASGQRHEPKDDEYLRGEWELIRRVLDDREAKFKAPPAVHPVNAASLEEATALLAQSRQALLDLVQAQSLDDMASISMPHPAPSIGLITVRGWLTIIAGHDYRHLEQIRAFV